MLLPKSNAVTNPFFIERIQTRQRLRAMPTPYRRITVALAFALVHLQSAAHYVLCGLGPPPGTSDFQSWSERTEQQRKRLGYLLVCDELLDRYRFEAQAAGDQAVRRKLAFEPRDSSGSAFDKFRFVGSIADGFGERGAAMYRRVYRGSEGEVITLLEFSLYGGAGVKTLRDDGLLRVRKVDGWLTAVQAPSGRGFTQLAWREDSAYFEVTIDRGLDNGISKARLVELAESLPRGGPVVQWK